MWLLRRHGVAASAAAGTVFIVNGLAVWAGMVVAAPLVLWGPVASGVDLAWLWYGLMLAGGAIALHPKVFESVGNYVLRRLGREPMAVRLRLRDYPAATIVLAATSCLAGVSLWLLARSITDVPAGYLPVFMSISAMGSVASFLAFFAPGGLGGGRGCCLSC